MHTMNALGAACDGKSRPQNHETEQPSLPVVQAAVSGEAGNSKPDPRTLRPPKTIGVNPSASAGSSQAVAGISSDSFASRQNSNTKSPSISLDQARSDPKPELRRYGVEVAPSIVDVRGDDSSSAVITVVRDPEHPLGKRFNIDSDGKVSKKAEVKVSFGIAEMHHVPTAESFVDLLTEVGNDPHAAIINAVFSGIKIGEPFLLLSAREIEVRTGISSSKREQQAGIHYVAHEGKQYKAVGRFKENVRPSTWQLLDRDIDKYTPPEFAKLTTEEWLVAAKKILPGLDQVTTVHAPSTSSRVLRDGQPIGAGNEHVWFMFRDAAEVERLRPALLVLAAKADLTWLKPRHSRNDPAKVVAQSLITLIDTSVWTTGRLVFIGQPTVSGGLTVNPISPTIFRRQEAALDTREIRMPDDKTIRELTRKAGVEMQLSTGRNGLTLAVHDLTLDTELETEHEGVLSVRELLVRGTKVKVRCQTPFRDSESFAAFYSLNPDGKPFIHDVGTGTTHWLNQFEGEEVCNLVASGIVEGLTSRVVEDCAAALENDAVDALATIKQSDPPAYQRLRASLKSANNKLSLTELDRSVTARVASTSTVQTHHGYAKALLSQLTEGDCSPVGHHGALFIANQHTGLWEEHSIDVLVHQVAEMHDGKDNCKRANDYRAIADHSISLVTDKSFFEDAPNGLACPGGFYQILGNQISLVPLKPEHRQRAILSVTPEQQPTPQFDKFLHETFATERAGEENQQIELLQEIVGGIMLGTLYKHQFATLFYEPYGRAGKGTLEKLIRCLVPKDFVSAISPFKWHQDYHVATLAGKRLNVVGELPENEAIPASDFKSVIGRDLVTGRHPTHRPITFSNEAAHLFMSNHLITTKDQSEAFFSRWKIIEFPNSRLRSGEPIDENLAQRIIDADLPGIAYWALKGAARLLRNGKVSPSNAHDRLMAKWRRSTNTLEEFIHEGCQLSPDATYRRSDFYVDYTSWCSDNGRKPFSKGRVKELLEHNIGLGIRLVELNGHETFRGVCTHQSRKEIKHYKR